MKMKRKINRVPLSNGKPAYLKLITNQKSKFHIIQKKGPLTTNEIFKRIMG